MKALQYLAAVFSNKCPRCRKGYLYKTHNAYDLSNNVKMNDHCPVCGQPTEIEVGFYYGTGYVSYALSVAFVVASFVAWKVLIGVTFAIDDNRIFYWMGTAIILLLLCQPLIMRLSRTLWLSWFVKYDADWKTHIPEETGRVIPEQMEH
jgi:uncharacterized protein (DUF983 family)